MTQPPTGAEVAAMLRAAATNRRAQADLPCDGPNTAQAALLLRVEADAYETAARVADGNLTPLYGLLPPHQWTPAMMGALMPGEPGLEEDVSMYRHLTGPARQLAKRMSSISEELTAAGWLTGTEWNLWDALVSYRATGYAAWGTGPHRVDITAHMARLGQLQQAADGWVWWLDGDTPEESGLRHVTAERWTRLVDHRTGRGFMVGDNNLINQAVPDQASQARTAGSRRPELREAVKTALLTNIVFARNLCGRFAGCTPDDPARIVGPCTPAELPSTTYSCKLDSLTRVIGPIVLRAHANQMRGLADGAPEHGPGGEPIGWPWTGYVTAAVHADRAADQLAAGGHPTESQTPPTTPEEENDRGH